MVSRIREIILSEFYTHQILEPVKQVMDVRIMSMFLSSFSGL